MTFSAGQTDRLEYTESLLGRHRDVAADGSPPAPVNVYIPVFWRQKDRAPMVALAMFLLNVQNKNHMGTWRDTFWHEMDFSDAAVLVEEVADADFILFPYFWELCLTEAFREENRAVNRLSEENSCPVVCHGEFRDVYDPEQIRLPFALGVYLNPALIGACRPDHAHGMSYFIPDCRKKYAPSWAKLPKLECPTVGFCGVAAPLKTGFGKTKVFDVLRWALTYSSAIGLDPEKVARRIGNNTKHAYRVRLIRQFQKHPDIQCDFVLRPMGGLVDNSYTNKDDQDDYNTIFYRNLESNLYNICCRGTENYSVRFYETLCMGRIPVVVDTDVVLPFDDLINYRKHCVWISPRQIGRAADILMAFHNSSSEEELKALQQSNRLLWEQWLCHGSYYRRISEQLRS